MKKLIITVAIVCAAAFSQAATCSWASGTMKSAANATGGWSSKTLTTALVTMNVYLIDDYATYQKLTSKSQADLYAAYKDKDADFGATNDNGKGGYKGAITYSQSDAPTADQYAVVIATYTDSTLGKEFYIANTATATYNVGTGTGAAGNLISAKSTEGWQAVPEPTSGLLLLLGVAGLALRRKQK